MKTQTAEEIFCKIHTDYNGEEITSLKQLKFESFTGEELFEFCQFVTTTQIEALRERLVNEFSLSGQKIMINHIVNEFLKEINN